MPNKKDIALFYLLSFTWGIILTLVGLIALIFVYIFMADKVEISTVGGRILVRFKEKRFGGVSLVIVCMVDTTGKSTKHELGHTIQHMWLGLLFIPIIAIPSVIRYHMWRYISKLHYKKYGKYPDYDSIWFEGQATRLGNKYFYDVKQVKDNV